jgi:hypothetical protein
MKLSMPKGVQLNLIRPLVLGIASVVLLLSPVPASAQLSRVGGTVAAFFPGGIIRGTDTAYDPVNDRYLLVMGYGPIYGIFVNASGQPVTSPFTISDGRAGFGSLPQAEYSPDVSNGAGGQGGFLVTWHQGNGFPNYVYARIVALQAPGRLVSGPQMISDGLQGGSNWENWPVIAYSRTSRRFLVAWTTGKGTWGIQGRFVDTNGSPTGSVMQFENPGGSRDPSIAWNSATDEFGLIYTGWNATSAYASFRRIGAADGVVSGRATFGFSARTFATAIDVNSATNRYVMAWGLGPGTMSAVFDPNGTQISTNFVTGRLGFDQSLGMAFNATTGTFLVVSSDGNSLEVGAAEMNGNGVPVSSAQIVTDGATGGSYYPKTVARTGTNQWDIVYSRDLHGAANQIVASGSNGASTPTPPPAPAPAPAPTPAPTPPPSGGCSVSDPFVALGGGTCVNGGWRPAGGGSGSTAPAPSAPSTPAPSTSTCTMPDPFGSIGGGTCVNGGWMPGRASTGGCAGADPFVAIGGGTCVNGGWRPGGGGSVSGAPAPSAPSTPAPSSSSCTTPDPFGSIGGGTCVNGGWMPGRASTGGCAGADPFTSIGGGTCANGGWVPGRASTGGCVGPDPFTAIGGGVCISGGWVPGRR